MFYMIPRRRGRATQAPVSLPPLGFITTLGGPSSSGDARFSLSRVGSNAIDLNTLCWEWWVRGNTTTNAATGVSSGAVYVGEATDGNILIDGDGFNTGRGYIAGFSAGIPYLGITANGGSNQRTLVGNASVLVSAWRHVCVQRDAPSGLMQVLANGLLQATVTGPTGDIRHATTSGDSDDILGGAFEKLFLGLGFGGDIFMPRLSSVLRYSVTTVGDPYTVPSARFVPDASTAWLALMTDPENPLRDDSASGINGTLLGSPPPAWTQGGPFP